MTPKQRTLLKLTQVLAESGLGDEDCIECLMMVMLTISIEPESALFAQLEAMGKAIREAAGKKQH
jgi:hypothetical protein